MRAIKHPFEYDREENRESLGGFAETRTKQQFKKECDINQVMAKFYKTGILTHLRKYGAEYGEQSSADLLEAMTTIQKAEQMYNDLPSIVRKKFDGPAEFLDYVQDPENVEELRKMGLARPEKKTEPVTVRIENPVQPENNPPDSGGAQ